MSIILAQITCELGIRVFWWTLQTREDVSDQSRHKTLSGSSVDMPMKHSARSQIDNSLAALHEGIC